MQKSIRKTAASLDSLYILANAIIVQAAKDYRQALRKQKKDPDNASALLCIEDVEQFFRSDWYRILTTVDGELLIREIRKEIAA